MSKREKTFSEPPVEEGKVYFSEAKITAGGIPAIVSTMKQAIAKMGVKKTIRTLAAVNQKDGFDCPGCAWPESNEKRSKFEFCENGAKAIAEEAMLQKITGKFMQEWSLGKLSQQSDYWLGQQGRLAEPLFLAADSSHYQPISWEKAFDLVADALQKLVSPDKACFYTSGRTSNEAAFLFQLFVRLYGTNNLPDCSNMCHESSGTGLKEVIGIGKGSVTLDDFEHADCILIIGQNPGTNHPRMLTSLQKAARNGCKMIIVNPLLEAGNNHFIHPQEVTSLLGKGTPMKNLFLPVKINGDVALLKGIIKEILANDAKNSNAVNHDFIEKYTLGFKEFAADIDNTSWDDICNGSGIAREEIAKAAAIIMASERMICCWAMGITQHVNGVANVQEIVNLLLLGGHLGKKGAGVCPVRGHSNVQGDRTMGIVSKPNEQLSSSIEQEFGFSVPQKPGYDTVEAIHAMKKGQANVFFAMGGNFLSATPDTQYTAEALHNCDLTVHVSTKLNRSHLITGKEALILPCLGRTEIDNTGNHENQFVSVENSMGIVHASKGNLTPASLQLKSEVEIIIQIAQKVFAGTAKENIVDWEKMYVYDNIRDVISRVIPGFEEYNSKVRIPGGFVLPNPVRDSLEFSTPSQKAHFTIHTIPKDLLPTNCYHMMTIRSHDQYNTTIYGNEDRYRGILAGRRIIFMNSEDMESACLQKQQKVDIVSFYDGKERVAEDFTVVPYHIPKRCVATYFPEANVLIPIDHKAEKSNTPASKSVVVSIRAK